MTPAQLGQMVQPDHKAHKEFKVTPDQPGRKEHKAL